MKCERAVFAVLLAFFAVFSVSLDALSETAPRPRDLGWVLDGRVLMPGDFIFRRGYGIVSDQIVRILGGRLGISHAGVIVEGTNGQAMVVHSLSSALSDKDGVQDQTLSSFISNARPGSTSVVRLRQRRGSPESMARRAVSLLTEGRRFDYEFELGTQDVYCSELLWMVLPEAVRNEATRLHPTLNLLLFETFFDDRFFDIVWSDSSDEGHADPHWVSEQANRF